MTYSPHMIDLSRLPFPAAIEVLSSEGMIAQFIDRFKVFWNAARIKNPLLPPWDVDPLEVDPVVIVGQAWALLRLTDRQRVNDAIRAVLAPSARGTDLDWIAASVNVERLTVVPANLLLGIEEVKESDESLLRRYLLAFDRPAAGSVGRYLYEAWTAWPLMGDIKVNGRGIHGRRGDTDIVVSGPGGRDATSEELQLVRNAVMSPNVQPEATGLSVLRAKRIEYQVSMTIAVPSGPVEVVKREATARVRAATDARTLIDTEVPTGYVEGAAYGPNVLRVDRLLPLATIAADPYSVPVCGSITIVADEQT